MRDQVFTTTSTDPIATDRDHGRVLRARPNPWSARRRGHLSEQDLASPLHIVGRRQVFDADHIIILMRAVLFADGLTPLGRFFDTISHCRTVSWCGHQYELPKPKASRAPRAFISIYVVAAYPLMNTRTQVHQLRMTRRIDTIMVAVRDISPNQDCYDSSSSDSAGDVNPPLGPFTAAAKDTSFRSSVERDTPSARAARRLQPPICDSTASTCRSSTRRNDKSSVGSRCTG